MTLKAQDSTEERVLAQEHNRTGTYVMRPHLLGISVGALAGGLLLFPSSSLNADLAWGECDDSDPSLLEDCALVARVSSLRSLCPISANQIKTHGFQSTP